MGRVGWGVYTYMRVGETLEAAPGSPNGGGCDQEIG